MQLIGKKQTRFIAINKIIKTDPMTTALHMLRERGKGMDLNSLATKRVVNDPA